MNTFKKKSLYVALAGIGALGVAGAAQAVNVNSNGLGQVLIYPYYTTQTKAAVATNASYQSLLSVVNSTASAKAVKVRFIEGRNSREVLDFNLFLSARDVWTAAVVPVGAGAGVFTTDHSCTQPAVSSSAAAPTPFVNFAYAGDGAGNGLDRTKEGYVEIFEMGGLTGATAAAVTHKASTTANAAVPANCAVTASDTAVAADITNPTGGLFGGISLINVLAGVDVTQNAVALDNFRTSGKYDVPADIKPDLRDVNPPTAVLFNGQNGVISATGFTQNVDAVSALFMNDRIYNEYLLENFAKSGTDWVVTMPTKRYYFDPLTGRVQYLFQRNFGANGACDDVGLVMWDREEQTPTTPAGFSPPPPPGTPAGLCWEANVVTFNGQSGTTGVLGSANQLTVNTLAPANVSGWADMFFVKGTGQGAISTAAHELVASSVTTIPLSGAATTAQRTFVGLPVIGFAVQSYTNGTLTTTTGSLIQANYAGSFGHRFRNNIQ